MSNRRPCPKCREAGRDNSGDNLVERGEYWKCYACEYFEYPDGDTMSTQAEPKAISGLLESMPLVNTFRAIRPEVAAKYDYRGAYDKSKQVHVANYRDASGRVVGQKVRTPSKDFYTRGDMKSPELWGRHLYGGGKSITITEGELDCLSVAQAWDMKWPTVSLPNGAQGAPEVIARSMDYLLNFETTVLMFDQDDPGLKAAEECAALFPAGRVKIAKLPAKDPNELLQEGNIRAITSSFWNAEPWRPDGVISVCDLREEVNRPIEHGVNYPWPRLNELTYGLRPAEFIIIGAGTGMGKSDYLKEIGLSLVHQGHKIGGVFLEEMNRETALHLMGKHIGKRLHIPDVEATSEEKDAGFDAIKDKVYLFDHFGTTDFEAIQGRIRYMVQGLGCRYILLDHLKALTDGLEGDINQATSKIVSTLAQMTRELGFSLIAVSHLRKSQGKAHEEGGRVHLDDFYGASALKQWASFVFGLERDQQAEDPEVRHTTTFRVLKDRLTGLAAGETFGVRYDHNTGRLMESNVVIDNGDF